MYNLDYVSAGNLAQTRADTEGDYFSRKKLNVLEIPDGIVVSGGNGGPGVFSPSGFVEESNFHNGFGGKKELPPGETEVSAEEVVFLGSFSGIWGHCITDNLKHLWILLDPAHPLRRLRFVYTMLTDQETLPDSFFRLLEVFGVKRENLLRVDGKKKFRKVYIPEQCFFCVPGGNLFQSGKRYYTAEYSLLVKSLKNAAPLSSSPEKVYFTRTAIHDPRDFGEKQIEDTFRHAGFTVVSPEKLNVFEQIALLKSCKVFAATQGSISLNAVFCDAGAEVILINKQNYCTPYQLAVNQARGGVTTIIDANRSVLNPPSTPWVGPFFMYKSRELCRWAHIRYKGFPLFSFLKYRASGKKP